MRFDCDYGWEIIGLSIEGGRYKGMYFLGIGIICFAFCISWNRGLDEA